MGQLVAVVEKPSAKPGIIRFEANRTLTGQGHEVFHAAADAIGPRPAAVVARRLLDSGQVESVHVYSNIVTVNLLKGFGGEGLDEIVRDLYQFWKPGMEPQVFDAPADEPAVASTGDAGAGGGGPTSAYEQRVPAVLRERAVAGRAKWLANHGS
jgi:hypothetical protein